MTNTLAAGHVRRVRLTRTAACLVALLVCVACGQVQHSSTGTGGNSAEVAAGAASSDGRPHGSEVSGAASMAGSSSSTPSYGGAPSNSAPSEPNASGASGAASKAGSGGGPSSNGGTPSNDPAGSAGAPEADAGEASQGGGGAPSGRCNDLELVVQPATCTTYTAPPAAQGGSIVPGTYALASYQQMPTCFKSMQQTLHIVETSAGVFSIETVANINDARASCSFVRGTTTLSVTCTCGGSVQNAPHFYDAYQQEQVDYLRIWNVDSLSLYQRVGD